MHYGGIAVLPDDRNRIIMTNLAKNFSTDPFPARYQHTNGTLDLNKLYHDYYDNKYEHLFEDFHLEITMEILIDMIDSIDKKKDAGPHLITKVFITHIFPFFKHHLYFIIYHPFSPQNSTASSKVALSFLIYLNSLTFFIQIFLMEVK